MSLRRLVTCAACGLVVYGACVRPRILRWGATDEEVRRSLPGDALVARPRMLTTRAITIRAPADLVWPWLAQMGQGRGGLYSYDWLENLLGLDIHSIDVILPQWQDIEPGDRIRLVPPGTTPDLALEVTDVEPGRCLVLRTSGDPATVMTAGLPYASWAFLVQALDDHTSRLIVRFRSDHAPTLRSHLVNQTLLEPVHFLMERKMLLGIRHRAERCAWRRHASHLAECAA